MNRILPASLLATVFATLACGQCSWPSPVPPPPPSPGFGGNAAAPPFVVAGGGTTPAFPGAGPVGGSTPLPGTAEPAAPAGRPYTGPAGGGGTPSPGGAPAPFPAPRPPETPGGATPRPAGPGPLPGLTTRSDLRRTLSWDAWWNLNEGRFCTLLTAARMRTPTRGGSGGQSAAKERSESAELLPALIGALRDRDGETRAAAAIALGRVASPESIEIFAALRRALADPDDRVRGAACIGLGLLGNADGSHTLLQVAAGTAGGRSLAGRQGGAIAPQTRACAALGLGLAAARADLPAATIRDLLRLSTTEESEPEVRAAAAAALQVVQRSELLPWMHWLFTHPGQDDLARAHLGVALGKAGAKSTIQTLRSFLVDPSPLVASSAAIALGLLADAEDRETVGTLIHHAQNSADPALRNFSMMALAELGGLEARTCILSELARARIPEAKAFAALAAGVCGALHGEDVELLGAATLREFASQRDPAVRAALATALGLLQYGPGLEALREALRDSAIPAVQGHAARALAMAGDAGSAPAILALLDDRRDPALCDHATAALRLLRDRTAGDRMRRIAEQPSASKRQQIAAIDFLGRSGDRSAAGLLREILDNRAGSRSPAVRAAAATALGRLGDKGGTLPLARLQASSNFLARTAAIGEVLDLR